MIQTIGTETTNRSAPVLSHNYSDLLDIIGKLRSLGISRFANAPQIIVCGDRSSGKSSVLEAVSGLSFPTNGEPCTRFATELSLRRSPTPGVKVRIKPGPDRSVEDKKRLARFKHGDTRLDIGRVVEDAKEAMGINSKDKLFSTDVLRIEISGPNHPHLTMVDLPGLFLADNKGQTEQDAALVKSLVLSYMRRPGSIILAVVSAKSDFALQQVIGHARALDQKGACTLGLITKPDTLDEGSDSEKSFVELAHNRNVRFKLGWHVLRNRNYAEHGTFITERDMAEYNFFSKGAWASLDPSQLGVIALHVHLSNILWDQTVKQLPNVLKDVQSEIAECQVRLTNLGASRRTVSNQRKYLLGASTAFSGLMRAAIDGVYTDVFFAGVEVPGAYTRRLRAVVQNILSDFSEQMRRDGHAKIIQEYPNTKENDSRYITQSAYIEEIKVVMKQSRGRELPGSYNPLVVTELFNRQCKPWQQLVRDLTTRLFASISPTISSIIHHVTDEKTATAVLRELVDPSIEELKKNLRAKVDELLEPHISGHPITYNQDLAANVQRAQNARQRRSVEEDLKRLLRAGSLSKSASDTLVDSLEPNMEQYSCFMAIDMMQAYYIAARKKIVDDIGVLAIERCVVQRLPHLFTPEIVWNLTDAEIQRIAAESDASVTTRERVTEKLRVLEDSMAELRKMRKQGPPTLNIQSGTWSVP
ncbi:P-loop containing nucleoside triphosphate hydrolase protein [Biscogniauxia marginata]|nr:P-loop containing nucleoside triphosphate hydrolase protein [Biscogniauxia marginata]